jgi:hypothetical protein
MLPFFDQVIVGILLWVLTKDGDGFLLSNPFDPYANKGIAMTTMPAQIHGLSGAGGSVGTFLSSVVVAPYRLVILQIVTPFSPNSTSPTFSLQAIDLGFSTQGISLTEALQLGSALGIDADTVQALDSVWRNNTLWVVFCYNQSNQ